MMPLSNIPETLQNRQFLLPFRGDHGRRVDDGNPLLLGVHDVPSKANEVGISCRLWLIWVSIIFQR